MIQRKVTLTTLFIIMSYILSTGTSIVVWIIFNIIYFDLFTCLCLFLTIDLFWLIYYVLMYLLSRSLWKSGMAEYY